MIRDPEYRWVLIDVSFTRSKDGVLAVGDPALLGVFKTEERAAEFKAENAALEGILTSLEIVKVRVK